MTEAGDVAVRAWARATGQTVVDGQPLPATVIAAYHAAHDSPPAPELDLSAWSAPRGLQAAAPPPPLPPPPPAPVPEGRFRRQPRADTPPKPAKPPKPPKPRARGKRDRCSVASLVAALLPLSGGIMAIVFGLVALLRIRKSHKRGRGMAITGIVIGTCWLVAITVVVARYRADRGPDGVVTRSGAVLAQELRGGDCLVSLPTASSKTLRVVPCREPHRAEVYAAIPLTESRYPGEAAAGRFAEAACSEALRGRVEPARLEALEMRYLPPNAVSWRLGEREVLCLLSQRDGGTLPAGTPAPQ